MTNNYQNNCVLSSNRWRRNELHVHLFLVLKTSFVPLSRVCVTQFFSYQWTRFPEIWYLELIIVCTYIITDTVLILTYFMARSNFKTSPFLGGMGPESFRPWVVSACVVSVWVVSAWVVAVWVVSALGGGCDNVCMICKNPKITLEAICDQLVLRV